MPNYSAYHWSEKARKYAETLGTIFNVKGRVNTVSELPPTGNKIGDVYLVGLVTDTDLSEYAWLSFDNVTRWEKLGSTATVTAFSTLTGSPYDNTALKNALDDKYDASNPDGYISGITSAMVTTALGYTPYNSSNPAGYTSNVGTVTSVNNVQPVNGNVTITIPNPLPSQTGNAGKFLTTDGTDASWAKASTYRPDLLEHKWADHILNDISWLRADTFSWQSGLVYTAAYNHLVDDIDGKTATTETIGSYTISYYLADDGHKITTDETNVDNIYNESGVAWYYILDTTNQRFKLPRTKYGFVGLRDSVGNYVPESLPNIKGNISGQITPAVTSGITKSGAFSSSTIESDKKAAQGSNYRSVTTLIFDASDSSTVYQDSAPVQQRATQMYLYFYVGNYNQSAIEQSAGITSEELNERVDLDASNLSVDGKSLISGLGMPSYRYENLTLGADGSTYTAPANGYYALRAQLSAGGLYIALSNGSIQSLNVSINAGNSLSVWVPCRKNDTIIFGTNASLTNIFFVFVYAEGEPNE